MPDGIPFNQASAGGEIPDHPQASRQAVTPTGPHGPVATAVQADEAAPEGRTTPSRARLT
jgi:hypothetical protein